MEHELGLTALFNQYLAGPGNALRHLIGLSGPTDRPWDNSIVIEVLVIALLLVTVAIVRSQLSVDNPGRLQHIFEMLHGFFKTTVDEVGIQHGEQYIPYIGTIFIFILTMNLIGIIPAFASPTMAPWVPAGLAVVTFIYFHAMGFQAHGKIVIPVIFMGLHVFVSLIQAYVFFLLTTIYISLATAHEDEAAAGSH
jgi:F-type H+-transporting ATPase subunit a